MSFDMNGRKGSHFEHQEGDNGDVSGEDTERAKVQRQGVQMSLGNE